MSKFKVGDRVVCIRANGTNLVEGQDYTVTGVISSADSEACFVELNGNTVLNFWESRFESIEHTTKANNDRPMIDAKALISFLEFNDWTKSDLLVYLNGYIDGAEGGSK